MQEHHSFADDVRAQISPGVPERIRPFPPDEQNAESLRCEIDGLRVALASRPVIDTARGILMALGSCTGEQAWQTLVHASQHSNVKLRDLAHQLVASYHGVPLPPATRHVLRTAIRAGRTS
ncbi:ANTAR domain-containing protein [Streptomyces finlayi]|uniref:ANTAR domain-containing protein n=1 Tax=Streptomyces finlayi TaxID=67296 RepID=A0A7G7BTL0_9ACTN|nr:ANTAR domain-containing protein [Streptomyces finlayi]QNE78675.1 ANTAR domain-containing protein [Streptomyces finlayi]